VRTNHTSRLELMFRPAGPEGGGTQSQSSLLLRLGRARLRAARLRQSGPEAQGVPEPWTWFASLSAGAEKTLENERTERQIEIGPNWWARLGMSTWGVGTRGGRAHGVKTWGRKWPGFVGTPRQDAGCPKAVLGSPPARKRTGVREPPDSWAPPVRPPTARGSFRQTRPEPKSALGKSRRKLSSKIGRGPDSWAPPVRAQPAEGSFRQNPAESNRQVRRGPGFVGTPRQDPERPNTL